MDPINITIRVAAKQAQAEIRAITKQLQKLQQQAQTQGGGATPTSAQQSKAAKEAEKAAAKARKDAEKQRAQATRDTKATASQQLRERERYLQREWRMDTFAARQRKAAETAATKATNAAEATRLKVARQANAAHTKLLRERGLASKKVDRDAANVAKQAVRERNRHMQGVWKMDSLAAKRAQAAAAKVAQATRAAERERVRIAREATTAHSRVMRERERILSNSWKRQTADAKRAAKEQEAVQRAHNKRTEQVARTHAARMAKTGGGMSPLGFAENLQQSKLVNAGKNINWVGRQLTYNFTLPLVAAGAGLFKFTMDIERATTHLSKVYGDITEDQKMLEAEVEALGTSFKLLSTYFGVNQVEVIEIGAAWAAAGSAGRGLAENTKATLETMILGDMEAQEAVEGLIAIQAQWGFSTMANAGEVSELTLQLAHLNTIENTTGISTSGLIDVIQRAGGTARTSGAEFRELAALASALVPATGDAAQAGTALRSIISSLMAPTAAASEALSLMGITVTDPSFMGQDVMGRLQLVAEHFDKLSDAQKGVVSSTIATKWQVSRFDVLMRQILDPLSFYNKALNATDTSTESLETRQRELNEVLKSHPKQIDIMTNAMKNALADAFVPAIPAIMSLIKLFSDMATAFSNLSPETQKWILLVLAAIAVLGPLMSFLGSTMQLLGTLHSGFKGVGKTIGWFIQKALFPLIKTLAVAGLAFLDMLGKAIISAAGLMITYWPVVLAIAAIVAAILLILHTNLEDEIWEVIKNIGNAFAALPKIVIKVFSALGKIIVRFMTAIWDALSYLNPFARHSPSLVDNVRNGVSTILDEYSRLNKIPNLVRSAAAALEAFSMATSSQGQSFREIELRKKANVTAEAFPDAGPAAHGLVDQILMLEGRLPAIQTEINAQERVVEQWTAALKKADDEIEVMEKALQGLEKEYDRIGNAISDAENKIGELAGTPIAGMMALEDQIFANQHAQNLLNLELLEYERLGISLDDIADKYARMAGEIELLQGTQAELRGAGAGSDILGWYDDQIASIRAQKVELGATEQAIQDIEDRLDALDLEGRFLALTKAINFDPLERQIDRLVNNIAEMPFDEIVRQIKEQQAIVRALEPQYKALGDQIEREKELIEAANEARDEIADKLDVEQEKLDALEESYSDIEGLIRDMESALSNFADSVKEAADEASRLEDLFDAAEDFDFEDFGGNQPLGREGWLDDIDKFNDELDAKLQELMETMGTLDLAAKLDEMWEKVKAWFRDLPNKIQRLWSNGVAFWGFVFSKMWEDMQQAWDDTGIPRAFGVLWDLFDLGWDVAWSFKDGFWQGIQASWDNVLEGFGFLWEGLKNIGNAFDTGWDWAWELKDGLWSGLQASWDTLLGGFWLLWQGIKNIGNAFDTAWDWAWEIKDGLWGGLQAAWDDILGGFWLLWEGIEPIFKGFDLGWDLIWDLKDGIWGAIQSAWDIILGFFQDLWDRITGFFGVDSPSKKFYDLGVDMIQGLLNGLASMMLRLGEWFLGLGISIGRWAYDNMVQPIIDAITGLPDLVGGIFTTMWEKIQGVWNLIGPGLQFVFDHSIGPVFGSFRKIFEEVVLPAFNFLKDNVIKPVMSAIFGVMKFAWNQIGGPISAGVNFFIGLFNKLADAVTAVAKFLGLGFELPHLGDIDLTIGGPDTINWGGVPGAGGGAPVMATGGVAPIDQRGGAYNTPRAIVGEGSRIHPEYVIPTDPQYRGRALQLFRDAGTQLMAAGGRAPTYPISSYETLEQASQYWKAPKVVTVGSGGGGGSSGSGGGGGVMDWIGARMQQMEDLGEKVARGAITAMWNLAKGPIDSAVNQIPLKFLRDSGHSIVGTVDRWVRGRATEWDATFDGYSKAGIIGAGGGVGPTGSGATAAGIPIHLGPGSWKAFTTLLNRMGISYNNLGTYSNRNTARTGNLSWHALDRAMDFGGSKMQLQAINHALYDAFKPFLHELIWTGPDSRNVFNGQDHRFRSDIANDHITHVHASMAQGGRFQVPHVPGGVNLSMSEGRQGEQFQILPVDDTSGSTTIVINGNLEFPNVTDGADAKNFIENLKALAV